MTHTLQPRWTIALTFCALAVAAACTSPKDDTPPPSIQVPSCTQISRFGNSALSRASSLNPEPGDTPAPRRRPLGTGRH